MVHGCDAGERRARRREAAGDRDARNVQGEGPPADTRYYREAGQGGERTQNMPRMSVTLEVSKLSGWLNDAAPCRKGGIRCGASCGPGAGRRGGTGTVCWAGLGYIQIGGRARVR